MKITILTFKKFFIYIVLLLTLVGCAMTSQSNLREEPRKETFDDCVKKCDTWYNFHTGICGLGCFGDYTFYCHLTCFEQAKKDYDRCINRCAIKFK